MTLLVRDEEELLEHNLEYHFAQGVDFVIATDHASRDSTPEILRRYEKRGLVRVFSAEGPGHHQSEHVTRMARLAATEYGADWVINNDADEFWWPSAGNLADVLAAIPAEYGQVRVPRNNFVPRPGPEGGAFYERLVIREKASRNLLGEPLERKVAHRGHPGVLISPGNHGVTGVAFDPAPDSDALDILHFPMRSFDQFERKVVTIGIGYESLPFRSEEVGRDQLALLELQRAGRLKEYFARHVLSDEEVEAGLRSGELVIDRRLATFMTSRVGRLRRSVLVRRMRRWFRPRRPR